MSLARRARTRGTAERAFATPAVSEEGPMRVAFAADHAGAALKALLIKRIGELRTDDELVDLGGRLRPE